MKKLYYQDIHQTTFTATVTSCVPNDQGLYLITLDQTAFFPEEGGQVADSGTLNGHTVLDVQIKNEEIYHITTETFLVGSLITGQVNWEQRFDFMQQHSGEHIVSGLVNRDYGYHNVGFHLGLEEVTLDFDGILSLDQLREIEKEANHIIWQSLPIQISYPDKDTLDAMNYRSKKELNGEVRIVEIPGVDICACCAPHVEHTGEIGLLKITGVQSHRGGVRVHILCGGRAIQDYTLHQDSVAAISVLLSSKPEQVAQAVERLQAESQFRKERINNLQAQLLELKIRSLPSPDTLKHVTLFTDTIDAIAMRNAVNLLTQTYPGYCCLFSGSDTQGYHFVIGSKEKDCRPVAALLRETFQSKGGGSAPMIQGSLKAPAEQITKLIQKIS